MEEKAIGNDNDDKTMSIKDNPDELESITEIQICPPVVIATPVTRNHNTVGSITQGLASKVKFRRASYESQENVLK